MKLLRDMECQGCGTIVVDVMADAVERRPCDWCDIPDAEWRTIVNGGMKARFRMNDWPTDPEFYRGQVKALDLTAKDSEGNDIYHPDTALDLLENYNGLAHIAAQKAHGCWGDK